MAHPPPETLELAPGYIVSRIAKGHWQLAARHGPAPRGGGSPGPWLGAEATGPRTPWPR